MFSQSMVFLITASVIFCKERVFNFYEVQLLYFIICAFDVISKKSLSNSRSERFTPVF